MNRWHCRALAALMAIAICAASVSAKHTSVLDHGAKPGFDTVCTEALQHAIDRVHADGGGTVRFPKGNYVTGTLFLKSNVDLFFENGAKLYGSTKLEDYAEVPVATEEPHFSKCLFFADGIENVTISGQDTAEINGRGYYFKRAAERPKLFRIERSKDIAFRDITVKNSGSWCLYFGGCDRVRMTRVAVYNKENHNNDGMNFDACSGVQIRDCNLQVEDDAICLKSSIDRPCEDIHISGCSVSSYHAAFKVGTASAYGFRDITIENCRFYDCRYGAIKLLVVDGGFIDNVRISDIELFNCGGPLFVRLGNRGRDYTKSIRQVYRGDAKPEGAPVGTLRNVYVGDVRGRLYGRNDAVEGIMVTGIPGHRVENLTLENIDLSFSGHGAIDAVGLKVPEDEARYPEQSFFGPLNSYGMFVRHAKNVVVKNARFTLRGQDPRPAFYFEDVEAAKLIDTFTDRSEGVAGDILSIGARVESVRTASAAE